MAFGLAQAHTVIVYVPALGLLDKVECVFSWHNDAYAASHDLLLPLVGALGLALGLGVVV